ncbi:PREDICTED: DENN domain-containing protein 1B-like, partial [Phaethon lepturus]|uniref:DENN domain-containing protein 1B-like n=1 Tax=Phaethon lepturus TaxID=97097 RepID=UPI000530900D
WLNEAKPYRFHSEPACQPEEQWTDFNTRVNLQYPGFRLLENPERTFDLVLKVKCQASENEDPVVLWKFPADFGDQEVLNSVPKFCFPFDIERVSQNQVGQHFTFVLTDIESKQRFGFCRLTSGGKVCLCILSYLPWFEVYYKLLNTLADYLAKEQENDSNDLLRSLYSHPVPKANALVSLSVNQEMIFASEQVLKKQPCLVSHSYFITPDITGLPTIPESGGIVSGFLERCHTCFRLDGNRAPGMVMVVVIFSFNKDLHSADAKYLVVPRVDCKRAISDHVLYDEFSWITSNDRASKLSAFRSRVYVWSWIRM